MAGCTLNRRGYLSGYRAVEAPDLTAALGGVEEYQCSCCKKKVEEPFLWLGNARTIVPVFVRDINALKAHLKYVEVWTHKGLAGISEVSLVKLQAVYPNHWVTVHRNAMIRVSAVSSVLRKHPEVFVCVKGHPDPVPVSRRKWALLRATIGEHLNPHLLRERNRTAGRYFI